MRLPLWERGSTSGAEGMAIRRCGTARYFKAMPTSQGILNKPLSWVLHYMSIIPNSVVCVCVRACASERESLMFQVCPHPSGLLQ